MAQAVPVVGDGEPAGFLGEGFLALQGLQLVFFGDLGGDHFEDVVRDPAQRDRVVLGGKADQVVLRLAAVLDRERVDALDDHHRLVLGDLAERPSRPGPARGRGPVRWRGPGGVWRPVWSAGWCWPSSCGGVGGTVVGAEVEAVGVVGVAELELGDLVPQLGQGGQVGLGLGRAQGPQPEVGDLVQLLGDGGDRGRDRVAGRVVECRCHTGNSGIDHRQSRTGKAAFRTAVEKYFESFWSPQQCGLDTRSLALAARPPKLRWRSLLDHRSSADARCPTARGDAPSPSTAHQRLITVG